MRFSLITPILLVACTGGEGTAGYVRAGGRTFDEAGSRSEAGVSRALDLDAGGDASTRNPTRTELGGDAAITPSSVLDASRHPSELTAHEASSNDGLDSGTTTASGDVRDASPSPTTSSDAMSSTDAPPPSSNPALPSHEPPDTSASVSQLDAAVFPPSGADAGPSSGDDDAAAVGDVWEDLPAGCAVTMRPNPGFDACYGNLTCEGFSAYTYCFAADEHLECETSRSAGGPVLGSELFRISGLATSDACRLAPVLMLPGKLAELGQPTCETTSTLGEESCHKQTGCTYELEREGTEFQVWQATGRDVDCGPPHHLAGDCGCTEFGPEGWGTHQIYSPIGVAEENVCDVVDELCEERPEAAPYAEDECSVSASVIDDYTCVAVFDCSATHELGGGATTQVGHGGHVTCSRGTPNHGGSVWSGCSCMGGETLEPIGGGSWDPSCVEMANYCSRLSEYPIIEAPECYLIEPQIEYGACAAYFACSAETEHPELSLTGRAAQDSMRCTDSGDGTWTCACPAMFAAGAESYTVDPGNDPDAACADVAQTCAAHIEAEGFAD